MTTYAEASEIMYAVAQDVADTIGLALLGYVPLTERKGAPNDKRKANEVWLRASRLNVIERQKALGQDNVNTKTLYETQGVLTIQVFAPKQLPTDYDKGEQLANDVRDAYRMSDGDGCAVEFANVTMREAPVQSDFYQFNVTVEYNYEDTV